MLLRSSSTPILNSWVPLHHSSSSSSPVVDSSTTKIDQFITNSNLSLPRTRSLSMITAASLSTTTPSSSPDHWNFTCPPHQTQTHSIPASSAARGKKKSHPYLTVGHLPLPRASSSYRSTKSQALTTDGESTISQQKQTLEQRLTSNSGLGLGGGGLALAPAISDDRTLSEEETVYMVAEGGGSDRGNNNRIIGGWGSGGGGGSDGQDGWSKYSDGNNGSSNTGGGHDTAEAYYQRMIDANPSNGLLLGNYAKFLKEVKGDVAKAEEYCERAILASPGDANVLSLYADIIWETKKDANRAEVYFDQAVQSSPDDCYVLASYAKFLWDAEEDEEEDGEEVQQSSSWTGASKDHFPSPISSAS